LFEGGKIFYLRTLNDLMTSPALYLCDTNILFLKLHVHESVYRATIMEINNKMHYID